MKKNTLKIILSLALILVLGVVMASAKINFSRSDSEQETSASETTESMISGQNVDDLQPTSQVETTPTTAEFLEPLPIDIDLPQGDDVPVTGLRRWPQTSSVPVLRDVDLEAYVGRDFDQMPLDGITVIVDPGHGGQDGGAQYPPGVGQPEWTEKEIVLDVSLLLRDELEALGATVIMLREEDEWLSIYRRIAEASRYILQDYIDLLPYHGYEGSTLKHLLPQLEDMIEINSDYASSGGRGPMLGIGVNEDMRVLMDIMIQYPDVLFLSLHCNALDDPSIGGLQVFHQSGEHAYETEHRAIQFQDPMNHPPAYAQYPSEERLRLATTIRDEVLRDLPMLEFGGEADILEANFAVLREMSLNAILLEMGFITNERDRELLVSDDGQQTIANAVARAVYAYYCEP